MASRDSDQGLYDPAAAYFVNRVRQLSGGHLRIVVVSDWASEDPDVEQQLVRAVAAGKVDLGAAGTRVFDTLGVPSFQALTAPMLIDSYPLEREVIASDIPGKMLDGLETLGVTGLAVLGEGLRKPVAVSRLLLAPSDWHGVTFAAFRSRGAADAIRALGARPSDLVGGPLTNALARRRIEGAENDLLTYRNNARQNLAPFVTANVNLWPRTEALLANPHRLSELTHEQQHWLRQAAADTAARSTSLFDHDRQIAVFLCNSGAHLANASHSQLVALRAVLAPVYARLEKDPETKAFITRIEQLKRATRSQPLTLPPGCTG
jgi:TRAP-type C4-dicarboxylate transport system substrate-binding protein